jgi:hypothetical protein
MRHEADAACVSWIPPRAVEGTFRLLFGIGTAHYDAPPPDAAPDVDALLEADGIRFANQLHAWIETDGSQITSHGMSGGGRLGSTTVRLGARGFTFAGVALPDLAPPAEVYPDRVRFTQTAGGHTGVAVPRRVSDPPYWRLTAPVAWSTIALTLHSDGSSESEIAGASPFPRHYLYDTAGQLTGKSAMIRYKDWLRQSGQRTTPWGGAADPAMVASVGSAAEQSVANAILVSGGYRQHRLPAGAIVSERSFAGTEVYLLLDGLLLIEMDGQPAIEAGPGAIFDTALFTAHSKNHLTVRARIPCRLAVLRRDQLDSSALLGVSAAETFRFNSRSSEIGPRVGTA